MAIIIETWSFLSSITLPSHLLRTDLDEHSAEWLSIKYLKSFQNEISYMTSFFTIMLPNSEKY